MLLDDELAALFEDLESDRVERTISTTKKSKIAEAICAFANDLPRHDKPGVIFVGVSDNGQCAHLEITDNILRDLGGLRSDGEILPLPVMSVQKRTILGCETAVIEVQPSKNPPVRYNGRCWIRVGPRRAQASAEEEGRLTEKRVWGSLTFDQHGVRGARVEDLNLTRFRTEYLPLAITPEVLSQNARAEFDQLVALRLVTPDRHPTNTAILVLADDPNHYLPGAYIQFVRFDGTAITDPIKDQTEIRGPLGDQIRQIDEKLLAHISTAADLSSGREEHRPDYPIAALRELVRNAVIHRTYADTTAPTRIFWYADRIEIISPGGPYGHVNTQNFGRPGIVDYRNPGVAEALKTLGFVQRFGSGIPRSRAELARNGNPEPRFTAEPGHVLVEVRPA